MGADYYKRIPEAKNPFDFHDGDVAYSVAELVHLAEQKRDFAGWCLINGHFEKWLKGLEDARWQNYAEAAATACKLAEVTDEDRLSGFLERCRPKQPVEKPAPPLANPQPAENPTPREKLWKWLRESQFRYWSIWGGGIILIAISLYFLEVAWNTAWLWYAVAFLGIFLSSVGILPIFEEWWPRWFQESENDGIGLQSSPENGRVDDRSDTTAIASHLRKLHTWHALLGVVGIFFSVIAAWVAWQESQLHEQQTKFDVYDRTLRATYDMSTAWISVFDADTRRRFHRVYQALQQTNTSPQLCWDLAMEKNTLEFDATNFAANHLGLVQLIGPELANLGTNTTNSFKIQGEISYYRDTLIRILNLYDSVAVLRQIARTNEQTQVVNIIEDQFWHGIVNRMKGLTNYMNDYDLDRFQTNSPDAKGWKNLSEELDYDHANKK